MRFDPAAIAAAKSQVIDELSASGQIGSDTEKKFTFDGNAEGRVVVTSENGTFVKISDATPNLHEVASVTLHVESAGETSEAAYDSDFFTVVDVNEGNDVLFGAKGQVVITATDIHLVCVVTDTLNSPIPSTGLYVAFAPAESSGLGIAMWTSEIEIGGLKRIDPKYLVREVDMTKYELVYEGTRMTLNDLIQYLTNASATGGGTLQHTGYLEVAGVRKAFSTTQQIVATITSATGSLARFPMMVSLLDGFAVNVSGTAFIYTGVPIEATTMFVFYNDPTSAIEVDIYVQAKALT